MIEENSSDNESSTEGTINAVTGLVKEIPIYQDAVQPIAKQTGKTLETVGRTVNAALIPIRGLVWGIEKIEEFVHTKVSKKLEDVPPENICIPDPSVAGPALESLKYTGHKESLSDLYANLLASAMDLSTAKNAHPGFVEIIRNMSSDEAKVLEYILENQAIPIVDIRKVFKNGNGGSVAINELVSTVGFDANCEHKELSGSYLINLERLGLIEIPKDSYLTAENVYDRILNDPPVKAIIEKLNEGDEEYKGDVKKYHARPTVFGKQFGEACVISRDKK